MKTAGGAHKAEHGRVHLIKPVQLGRKEINGQSLKSKSKVHAVPRGPETHCNATHINYQLVCMHPHQNAMQFLKKNLFP